MCIYNLLQVKDSTVYENGTDVIKKKKKEFVFKVGLTARLLSFFFQLNESFGTGLLLPSVSAKYLQRKYMCVVAFPFMPLPIHNSLPATGTGGASCPQRVFPKSVIQSRLSMIIEL